MRLYYFYIAASVFETSGSTCPATQRHISEELNSRVQQFKLMNIRKGIQVILTQPQQYFKTRFLLTRL
jgi:hypothetical protein